MVRAGGAALPSGRRFRLWPAVARAAVSRGTPQTFRFVNGGYIDGINFQAGCAGRVVVTAWEVVGDASTGKVTGRAPLDNYLGAGATKVTATSTPALAPARSDVSRVNILRSPVA